MRATRFLTYCFIVLVTSLVAMPLSANIALVSLYALLLYIDANDHNMRSLIVITTMIQTLFYELDRYLFVAGAYYWDTGPIAGDALLNILTILNYYTILLCIYFRVEIMNAFNRLIGGQDIVYYPTRADAVQAIILKITLYAYLLFCIYWAYLAWGINALFADQTSNIIIESQIDDFKEVGKEYMGINAFLEALRHLSLILLTYAWFKTPLERTKDIE